ncbi:effector-associated domain EAD1-containing protein [Parafrankia sp. EUN1f]|uniref:effector-associated domain EAD1-containing protein n=1 Tax=Parafrankia sp. EUN1f TaxID=102897 RepID=UPI0001C44A71|nr:effector-associated domain EAD1-containing protein [Parafrankia sp. EUN1f]EFC84488.1 hypothetical protein FrEUN1fDRAFT_2418 [Parafrankia sp. EUN1f]
MATGVLCDVPCWAGGGTGAACEEGGGCRLTPPDTTRPVPNYVIETHFSLSRSFGAASHASDHEHGPARLSDDVIETLAEMYDRESSARQFLDRAGFPSSRLPSWQVAGPLEFWREVARLVRLGIIADGPRTILHLSLADYPGNPVLLRAWGQHGDGDLQKKPFKD